MEKLIWQNPEAEKMTVVYKGEVVYLTWPALTAIPFVNHGFTTRMGGVSEGEFAAMNLSFTRGDKPEHVRENYRRLAQAAGFSESDLVCSDQTHTINVRVVTEADRGKGYARLKDYRDVDALVTDVPGLMLMTYYADCVPLYFVDPVHGAVGLAHSGWRGTVADIAKSTLEVMERTYGTSPKDVLAAIGPSICQSCYEISSDVAEVFAAAYPQTVFQDMIIDKKNGKYQLDLWKACRYNISRCGVEEEHIYEPNLCTCCNPALLFSHRASGGRRGNLAAFLGIRS